ARGLTRTMIMPVLRGMHVINYNFGQRHLTFHCHRFDRMANWAVRAAGCRWGFRLAVVLLLAWAIAGPVFRFHQSWTTLFTIVTSSVTFLLFFLIQNVQNRELKAVHLKLDELILSEKRAHNDLIDVEYMTEEQLDRLGRRYSKVAALYRQMREQ